MRVEKGEKREISGCPEIIEQPGGDLSANLMVLKEY
jgi:hypothetical protein